MIDWLTLLASAGVSLITGGLAGAWYTRYRLDIDRRRARQQALDLVATKIGMSREYAEHNIRVVESLESEGDRRFHRWQGALVPFPAGDVAAIFVQHDFLEDRGLFDTHAEYLRVAVGLNAQIDFYNIMMAGVSQGNNRAASDQITLAREHIAPKCKELLEILDRFRQRLAEAQAIK